MPRWIALLLGSLGALGSLFGAVFLLIGWVVTAATGVPSWSPLAGLVLLAVLGATCLGWIFGAFRAPPSQPTH